MSVENYEKIWREWLKWEIYNDVVDYHSRERGCLIKYVQNYLDKGKKFLEIGCGTAVDSYLVRENLPECEGYAVDLSLTALKVAQKIGNLFSYKLFMGIMDGEKLAFKDNSFDVIFSQGVLEHFRDPSVLIEEQMRILKDNGYLIVCVPQKYNPYTLYKHKMMKKNEWEWGWETEYSLKDLKKIGERFGLKVVTYCGHEYVRTDYGLWYLRNIVRLLQKRNPLRSFFLFKLIEKGYDKIWQFFEKRWGHNFMVNITIVYENSA